MNTIDPTAPAAVAPAPVVMTASATEREAVLDVIARAFASDPVCRWAFPDPERFHSTFRAFADAFGGRAFEHDSARYLPGFLGAALWLPPGAGPDEAALMPLLEREVPPRRLSDLLSMLAQMGGHHPAGPHWYLPLIGVDPNHQGRGHGSALLRHAAERLDRAGDVAYLESTHPLNLPLYERFGFEVCGTIQVGDAPPVYPMVRYPK